MKIKLRTKLGFTLIELLVVMVIIAMLAALLFPVIGKVVETAKKTKARTEVMNLKTAFHAYYTEFGVWPPTDNNLPGQVQDVIGDIVSVTFTNSRNIIYYDFSTKKEAMRFVNGKWRYYDPWKHPYRFRVDHDYNNSIQDPFDNSQWRPAGVLVWSLGPNANVGDWQSPSGTESATQPNDSNRIKSW